MKKLFAILVVLALLAVSCAEVNAQRTKGTKFLSPQLTGLDFGSYKLKPEGSSESMKLTQFGLNLAGGQFISDDLALKANLGYTMISPEDEGTLSLITLGVGVRYYLASNFFGGVALGYNSITMKPDGGGDKTTFSAIMVPLEAGYSYMLTEKIAFEPSLNYSLSLSGKMKQGSDSMDFDLTRFGLTLGITVFF